MGSRSSNHGDIVLDGSESVVLRFALSDAASECDQEAARAIGLLAFNREEGNNMRTLCRGRSAAMRLGRITISTTLALALACGPLASVGFAAEEGRGGYLAH